MTATHDPGLVCKYLVQDGRDKTWSKEKRCQVLCSLIFCLGCQQRGATCFALPILLFSTALAYETEVRTNNSP